MAYLYLLRPQQWVKNLFIFAGLIFGRRLTDPLALGLTLVGFVLLCLASSGAYVVNDIVDRSEDRLHPRKARRPLASGAVSVGGASVMALGLLVGSLAGAFALDVGFGLVVIGYLLLQVGYTFGLKHAVILDVIAIGVGFVLRAVAGAVLLHVEISHWLVLCTFTLCLFLGFSKRRCELNALSQRADHASRHRRTLALYTPDLLNHMTTLTAGIAVVSFMLYATDDRTVREFQTNYLLYTLPLVVYAIFRFAVIVEHGDCDGPTDVVLRDRPFQVAVLLWMAAALLIVYRGAQIRDLLSQVAGRGGL